MLDRVFWYNSSKAARLRLWLRLRLRLWLSASKLLVPAVC